MATKKKIARKKKVARKKKRLRTKPGVNKSQAIRDYLAKHRNAKAATVVEELGKQGIKVTVQLVYQQQHKKKGNTGRKTGRSSNIAVDDLLAAKKLVEKMGGIERAKTAISVLESLK